MNTMLATTDTMTLTRMAVIGRRTNSALMAGAKAMMVENVKNQMRNGVAHFVYMKKSGELREAFGTTSKALGHYSGVSPEENNAMPDRWKHIHRVYGPQEERADLPVLQGKHEGLPLQCVRKHRTSGIFQSPQRVSHPRGTARNNDGSDYG